MEVRYFIETNSGSRYDRWKQRGSGNPISSLMLKYDKPDSGISLTNSDAEHSSTETPSSPKSLTSNESFLTDFSGSHDASHDHSCDDALFHLDDVDVEPVAAHMKVHCALCR